MICYILPHKFDQIPVLRSRTEEWCGMAARVGNK